MLAGRRNSSRRVSPVNVFALILLMGFAFVLLSYSESGREDAKINRVIIPGDRLRINIAEQPDLNKTYPVAGDGTIDFSFIGRLTIAEMTLSEAADYLERVLEENYFKSASVSIEISEFVSGDILVIGAVASPGQIGFKGDEIMTLMEAISRCGGLAQGAAGSRVKIIRWKPGGGMERQILTIDIQNMFETLDFSNDQYLRPRDIVLVPSLGDKEGSEFLVLGAVSNPGFYPYSKNMDILRAIVKAGGANASAKWNSARLLRPAQSGGYNVIPVNLFRLFGAADMSMNIPVLPGDILFIPPSEQAMRGQVYLLGEVTTKGVVNLPMDTTVTLAKTILATGGFSKFANESKVRIQRTAPDGSKQTLVVDVGRILKTGAFEDDVPLENEDVIIVPERILGF